MARIEAIIKAALQREIKGQNRFYKDGNLIEGEVVSISDFDEFDNNGQYSFPLKRDIYEITGKWGSTLIIKFRYDGGFVEKAFESKDKPFHLTIKNEEVISVSLDSVISIASF